MRLDTETQREIKSLRRKAAKHRRTAAEHRLEHTARKGDPYGDAPLYGLCAAADLAEADRLERTAKMLERGFWK